MEVEVFLFGNLELAYSLNEIKKLDLHKFKEINFYPLEIDIPFVWRMYKNFRTLFSFREVDILNDTSKYKFIIDFFGDYIREVEKKFEIKDRYINLTPKTVVDYFKLTIYAGLTEFRNFIKGHRRLEEQWRKSFYNYLPFIEKEDTICSFKSPFKDNKWTPKWELIYDGQPLRLGGIDCYLDTFFFNSNFYYSRGMEKTIQMLVERILFLKKKAPGYYTTHVQQNLKMVSHRIFEIFPYQLIYKHYRSLIEVDDYVFKPILSKLGDFNSDLAWMLSILPHNLSCYLLGYPIITASVPSPKNIIPSIKKIDQQGLDEYVKRVEKRNQVLIKEFSCDVSISNAVDDDENYLDVAYQKVKSYNFNDVVMIFCSGTAFLFTAVEFEQILKKGLNYYNNQKFPSTFLIEKNIYYKNSLTNDLGTRGINTKLNGTLRDNIEEIQKTLESDQITIVKKKAEPTLNTAHTSIFNSLLFRR
jgi:hypothetical protein